MEILVGLLIAGMIVFAVWSSIREIQAYKKYLKGDKQYLVSKKRRNRRVLVAALLILEAVLLSLGIFVLHFENPVESLLYWIVPTVLIICLVVLGMRDFQETSHDLDVIVRETSDVILKHRGEQITHKVTTDEQR